MPHITLSRRLPATIVHDGNMLILGEQRGPVPISVVLDTHAVIPLRMQLEPRAPTSGHTHLPSVLRYDLRVFIPYGSIPGDLLAAYDARIQQMRQQHEESVRQLQLSRAAYEVPPDIQRLMDRQTFQELVDDTVPNGSSWLFDYDPESIEVVKFSHYAGVESGFTPTWALERDAPFIVRPTDFTLPAGPDFDLELGSIVAFMTA